MPRENKSTFRKVILLVDDEPTLRTLVRKILERAGHTVLEGAGPHEALELARRHPMIDLLLTDVVMPEMGGVELAREVEKIAPNARVLYMSGYPDETLARQGVPIEKAEFLRKPFSPELLAKTIRRILE